MGFAVVALDTGRTAVVYFAGHLRMSELINIYCDESCHLEDDGHSVMVLGAVWCPVEKAAETAKRLRELKSKHRMPPGYELKWTTVAKGRVDYFRDVLDYFFDDDDLHFRALIATKAGLQHDAYGQSHDEWYYKMLFEMLKVLFDPEKRFRVYFDYKDTHGGRRIAKLHDVLSNSLYDFSRDIVERVQLVRSHEVELMQLTDFLCGAIGYLNRGLATNPAKLALIDRMKERSKLSLVRTTLLRAEKVNLLRWNPQPSTP